MKISRRWLKDYVKFDISPEELADRLTLSGIEIGGVTALSSQLPGVVVGEVLSREKHPDADRLSVCQVDVGGKVLSIVCGAPNVEAGQKVPVAPVGTVLPGDFKIEGRKIRGVISQGMICSEKELNLSDEAAGIMVLQEDAPLGKPIAEVLPLDDDVLDADLTPNRPDCLSMVGVAREVAIISGTKLRHPDIELSEGPGGVDEKISVAIHDPQGCPRYSARFIEGVRIGPSPVWLSRRLMATGVRSINNVVDATNYVMLEMGQPLHAFDYDLLRGRQIQVRRAQEGENFVTLDEKEHTLTPEILLICDGQRPVALAGIMGGLESEVRPETANVLLESAYFEPTVIRRGSKALNISTESSQRFERGIDPNAVAQASDRAAQLIVELAGGTLAKGIVDQYPGPIAPRKITLRIDRVNRLLGTRLTSQQISDFLKGLEFDVSGKDPLEVVVPTFRPDITREIDLVEEVARLYGYDRIEATVQAGGSLRAARQEQDDTIQKIRSALCGLGLQEVVTSSLVDPKILDAMGISEPARSILNPLSEDLSVLRPSLVPSILQVLQHNRRRDVSDVRIFEVGKIFRQPRKGESTDEAWSLSGLLAGKRWPPVWGQSAEPVDFYDLRGLIDSLMEKLSIDKFRFLPYDEGGFFQTGRAAALDFGQIRCGTLGQLAPGLHEIFDTGPDVMLFELQIAPLAEAMADHRRYTELPRFPAAERDLAIVVGEEVPAGEVSEAIRQTGGQLVVDVHLFDLYRGKQIPSGKKGLAYSIRYQSPQKTLTDSEVEEIQGNILKVLGEKFGAELRES